MTAPATYLSARTATTVESSALVVELVRARSNLTTAAETYGETLTADAHLALLRSQGRCRAVEDRVSDLLTDLIYLRDGVLPAESSEVAS